MTIRLSIVHDLPQSRWRVSHMPNKQPVTWPGIVKHMRRMWNAGEDTLLETAFVEWFEKPETPIDRLNSR